MISLKKLDMSGCRGDHRIHERKVWAAIRTQRKAMETNKQQDLPKP